jgi:hypothetical protein
MRCSGPPMLIGGHPLIISASKCADVARAMDRGIRLLHITDAIGAWPSGKATGFGPVIPGSNPGAPATVNH